jgi:hypothetical protein
MCDNMSFRNQEGKQLDVTRECVSVNVFKFRVYYICYHF